MKAVLHILYKSKDDVTRDNLFKNKKQFDYTHKHFILTNYKNIEKSYFKNFEQIFFFNNESELLLGSKSILRFLSNMKYTEVYVVNNNRFYTDFQLHDISELLAKFSVVNNFTNT